jgi:hypothetical protein
MQTSREFAAALGSVVIPEILALPGLDASLGGELDEALRRAVTPETMGALATLLRSLSAGENSRDVLSGDLAVISIAEILQLLALQRQTGTLSIFTRNAEVDLYIRDGNLDFAGWRGLRDEFLLGRYLIEEGALTRADLKTVLDNRAGSKRLLGETLLRLSMVTEEQLRGALARQTSELVYEVVRWEKGRFSFTVGEPPPEAGKSRLALATSSLVMEGFRRVDEWRLIEGSFDFNEVLYRDQVAIERLDDDTQLTRQERHVLEAIDGEHTVREIVDLIGGSSFELCKILYQFLHSRLVRRKAA